MLVKMETPSLNPDQPRSLVCICHKLPWSVWGTVKFKTRCSRCPGQVLIQLRHTHQIHTFQKSLSPRNGCEGSLLSPSLLNTVCPTSSQPPLLKSPQGITLPLCRWIFCLFKLSHVNPGQSRRCIFCTFTRFTLAEWVLTCALGTRVKPLSDRGNQVLELWVRRPGGGRVKDIEKSMHVANPNS